MYSKILKIYKRKGIEGIIRLLEEGLVERSSDGGIAESFYWKVIPDLLRVPRYGIDAYDIDIDPFATYYVDSDSISKFTGRTHPEEYKLKYIGSVKGGTWDQEHHHDTYPEYSHDFYNGICVEKTDLHQTLQARFVDGIPWKETTVVQQAIELVDQGHIVWHDCSSRKGIRQRCEYLDTLYETIRDNGYYAQSELDPAGGILSQTVGEIVVDIGRDGELLFVDGRHRLSIAKLLDLDSIPITVLVRHRQYMENLLMEDNLYSDNYENNTDNQLN